MSRPLSSSVQTEIAKLSGARPRTLFELELEGGTIRYTDHHENLTFDSETYYARQIKHTAIKSYMENRVDNTTIEINNVDKALSAYFASEDFQGRKVKIKKIFLGLTAAEDFILQFEGWMEAPKLNQGRASIKCTNKFDRSESKSPWRRFGIRCNWDFCGTECAYNSGTKQTGTADSGSTTTAVDAALPARADDYWKGAKFLVTGGTNRGRWRYVNAYVNFTKTLTFLSAFPEAIDATTEYVLECDKSRGTCETFANRSQFDGFDEAKTFNYFLPPWQVPALGTAFPGGAVQPSDAVMPIMYGEGFLDGVLIDEHIGQGSGDFIYGLCAGEIDSVQNFYARGALVTGWTAYTGTDAQSFSFHSETKYYRKTAVVQIILPYSGGGDTWGERINVTAHIKGLKVQKYLANGTPDGAPAWSDNPIWCLLDYLMNRAAEPTPAADIDFAAFKAAADTCDTLSYKVSMKLVKQEKDALIIDRFLLACRGYRTYYGGKMGVHIEQAASSSHSFDMDNIKKGSFSYERRPPNDVPNRVILTYTDTEVRKIMAMASATVLASAATIPYKNASGAFAASGTAYLGGESFTYTSKDASNLYDCTARANDYPGGYPIFQGDKTFPELTAIWNDYDNQAAVKRVIEKKIDGKAIPTYGQAYSMAEFIGRKGMDCNLFVDLTGLMDSLGLTVGDRVSLDHDVPGWSGADFRVVEASESKDEEVKYLLQLYDATIYEENAGAPASPLQTSLPSPFDAPPHVTNLAVTESIQIQADGTARAVLLISFDEPTGDDAIFWHHADIFYTTDNWATTQFYGSFNDGAEVPAMPVEKGTGTTYKFKAVSVSTKDVSADIAYAPEQTKVPNFDTTAPSAPTGLTATAIVAGLRLDWTNPTDKDFLGVQIFRNTTDSFPGGVPYACVAGEPGKAQTWKDRNYTYGQTYYYWLKAVDRSGNASSQTSSVNAIPGQISDPDIAALNADKINAGTLRSINSFSAKYSTKGTYLTAAYPGHVQANDLFTGDNGTLLQNHTSDSGHSWLKQSGYTYDAMINTNRIYGPSGAGEIAQYYLNTDPSTVNQYRVKANIYVASLIGGAGVIGRAASGANTSYFAQYNTGTSTWYLYKVVAGAATSLGTYAQVLTVGNTYEVELRISDSAKEVWIDGVQRITSADNAITAEGYAGVRCGQATSSTGLHVDNFEVIDEGTLDVENTGDFASSGSGWIIDSTNDRDAFSWTGKTSTTLTGCTGVAVHNSGALVIPASKAIFLDDAVNEMRFFGDRGDGTVEELASIGIKDAGGGDYVIGNFGSVNNDNSRVGLIARSYSNVAIMGISVNGDGAYFQGSNEYGVFCSGGKGPIVLVPSASASAPSHSADKGTLWPTSAGVLYINIDGSTTWQKVGAQ